MKLKVLVSLMLVGIMAFAVGMGTFAYFTSQAASDDNVFETGTLKIGVPNEGANAAFINATNWQPGDSVSQDLDVKNLGSLPYKYKVSASMTEGDAIFYDQLMVEIKQGTRVVYNGLAKNLSNQLVTDNVADGVTEVLSFKLTLPTSAGNECQDKTAKVKFTFDATQTNNSGWSVSGI